MTRLAPSGDSATAMFVPCRTSAIWLKAPDEVAKYKASKDPLSLFRNRVTEAKLLDGKALDAIDRECKQRIKQCVTDAKAAPTPTEADLLTDVYTSAY